MNQPLNVDVDALKLRLRQKMDTLPQRDAIETSDANQWIDYMAHIMPREAMWHMIRAGGVGGSEIGGLVRNYMGRLADHNFSATKWAEGKLLRRVPDLPRGVTERGHFMEPSIAKMLYEQTGARRDEVAYTKLEKAQGQLAWMRYSPDDVVIFDEPTLIMTPDGPQTVQGRVLVDYKAPTVVEDTPKIPFQYACQLHQGSLLCEEQGIELDTTILVQFDWARFGLRMDVVDINQELCALIPEVGNHYWDHVMNGRIPAPIIRKRAQIDPKDYETWQDAAIRLAQINAMTTRLEKESTSLRDKLIVGLGLDKARLGGDIVKFDGAINISSRTKIDADRVREALGEDGIEQVLVKEKQTKYDTPALVRKLKEMGVDVKPYRIINRIDPDLAIDALIERNLDPEDFIEESHTVWVDSGMKNQAEDWFEASFPPLDLPGEPEVDELTPEEPDEQNLAAASMRPVA